MKSLTKINNYMKTEFLAMDINESLARGITAFFIMPLDPGLDALSDVKTAVSEAVTNSIIHGYRGCGGMITMELTLKGRELTVTVRDSGVGIEDIERARTPLFTTQPEAERSGMGFTVMETFMDELYVESVLGEGTTVTMKKQL